MKKYILFFTLAATLLLSTQVMGQTNIERKSLAKPINEHKLKKMDKRLTESKAVKRVFKTQKEFKRMKHKRAQRKMSHYKSSKYDDKNIHVKRSHRNYDQGGYGEYDEWYIDDYRPIRQQGYKHTRRGWYLAYRYDRASFYDKYGYYYGYFNRYGYYFEDVFYRYDRYYNYHDRVKGKGLFDQRYYMPSNYGHYGFCAPRFYR